MNKYLSFCAKTANIGPVDPEIICLRAINKNREKKKEINASKIYSLALPASLPSGLEQAKRTIRTATISLHARKMTNHRPTSRVLGTC